MLNSPSHLLYVNYVYLCITAQMQTVHCVSIHNLWSINKKIKLIVNTGVQIHSKVSCSSKNKPAGYSQQNREKRHQWATPDTNLVEPNINKNGWIISGSHDTVGKHIQWLQGVWDEGFHVEICHIHANQMWGSFIWARQRGMKETDKLIIRAGEMKPVCRKSTGFSDSRPASHIGRS